jgi:hypothetical protein
MPNWCLNRLVVTGAPGDCAEFRALAQGTGPTYGRDGTRCEHASLVAPTERPVLPLSFHATVPVPDDVLAADAQDAVAEWQQLHWGSKWELTQDTVVEERADGCLAYTFHTPWAPPEAWLRRVAQAFPWLNFALGYFEPGMVFCGVLRLRARGGWDAWYAEEDVSALVALARDWFDLDVSELLDDSDRVDDAQPGAH